MATWEDGAAYAPTERPDGFATPRAEPLESAPPRPRITPGAVARPRTLAPVDAPPLASHGPDLRPGRDPRAAFDVQSATITTGPTTADGSRDPRTPFAVSAPVRNDLPDVDAPPPPGAQPITPAIVEVGNRAPSPLPPARQPGPPSGPPPSGPYGHTPAGQMVPRYAPPAPQPGPRHDPPPQELHILLVGLGVAGALIPVASPLLLLIAGGITVSRVKLYKRLGPTVLAIGGFLLMLLMVFGTDDFPSGLGLLASVCSALAYVFARSQTPKPPSSGGGVWYGPGSDIDRR